MLARASSRHPKHQHRPMAARACLPCRPHLPARLLSKVCCQQPALACDDMHCCRGAAAVGIKAKGAAGVTLMADGTVVSGAAAAVAPAPAPRRARWAVGPLLRFASGPAEAAFQLEQASQQGAMELCWSALACAPSVLLELRQRPPVGRGPSVGKQVSLAGGWTRAAAGAPVPVHLPCSSRGVRDAWPAAPRI